MERSNRCWLVLLVATSMLMAPGCSDDTTNPPIDPQAIEAGLDSALQETVGPLVAFIQAFNALLSGATPATATAPAALGGGCPNTTGWCSTGSVTCLFPASAYEFDFDECEILTGGFQVLVDGNLDAVPGSTVDLTLTNLFIDNSPAISGSASINQSSCTYSVDVSSATEALVSGTVVICDGQDYPTADTLAVSFDPFVVTITFDGTNTAAAVANQGAVHVADCTIDLDPPFTSSCTLI